MESSAELHWQARLSDALHFATTGLINRLDFKEVFENLISQACQLLGTPHAFIDIRSTDGRYMEDVTSRGVFAAYALHRLERGQGMVGQIWQTGQPLRIPDYQTWPHRLATSHGALVRSAIGVPICSGDEIVGVLGCAHIEVELAFGEIELDVLERFANLASLAYENTRLYRAERRNQQVAESLRDVLNVVNTESSLDKILEFILLQAAQLNNAQKAALVRVNPSRTEIIVQCAYGIPVEMLPQLRIPTNPEVIARSGKWEGLVFPDRVLRFFVRRMRTMAATQAGWEPALFDMRSYASGQIHIGNEVFGGIMLFYDHERVFTREDQEVMRQLTTHASIAIQTARLRAQSAMNAASQERSRLGRELHDSVSQALFSIVLHAQAAEKLATLNPARLHEPLTELLRLSQAALTEMRALIFEMRPELLEKEGLLGMFRRQAEAMKTRHKLGVQLDLPAQEPEIPIKIKEAVYRVSLEAINNIVKHAQARNVQIAFDHDERVLRLRVSDDGVGFDAEFTHDGHLGLITMRERIDSLNGRLDIDSDSKHGTIISLEIPVLSYV